MRRVDDRTIHILLVEDNAGDARLIQEMLTEAATTRFKLTHASCLDEGLKRLAEASFDVLLLDLGLPDSQGLDTFNTVYHAAPAMPVLVFTGLADEELGTKAVRAGAQDYLMKGQLDGHLLGRTVRYAIERKRAEEELRQARDELEGRVAERTAELTEAVEQLQHEIAQRRHAERAVRESEERYRALFEQAPDSILLVDLHSAAIVGFNDRAHESLGYTREEFENLTIADLEAVESRDELARHMQRVISEGSDVFETTHRTKDGHLRNVLVSAKVIRLDQKDILQFICSDITERKRAEEERDRLFDLSPDMICIAGFDGYFKRLNSAFERTLGYTRDELLARPFVEFVHGDDQAATLTQLAELISGGTTPYFENRYRCREGSYRWLAWTAVPDVGRGLFYAVARDMTDRKLADEALRFAQFATDHAADAIYWMGADARFIYVNQTACRALGYSREELLSMTVHDIDPDYPAETWPKVWEEIKHRGSFTIEARHRCREGKVFPVEITVNYLEFDGREYNCSIVRDISERKRADEARGKQHALLQAIIEGTTDAISVKHPNGRYLMVNSAAARAFGRPKEDVIGKRDAELLSAESAKGTRKLDRRVMVTGELHASEEPITIGNVKRMYSSARTPYRDGEGNIIGVIGIARDITEQRHLEEEILSISRREQQRIGQDLHDAMGQHLTGIAFLAKVLAKKLNASGAPDAAQATQIEKMINEGITLARGLAQGLCPVAVTAEGLMSALGEYRAHVESLFGVVCSFRCEEPMLVRDEAAATHLYRIVQEAVNNALKHGKARRIEITMAGSDGSLTLAVKDDGKGLPGHFDNNKGMGLRIMAYRARMIGATLDIQRTPGGGAVVVCSFQSPTVARGDDRS